MSSRLTAVIAAAALAILAPSPAFALDNCDVTGYVYCSGGENITISWSIVPGENDPPIDRPDWVGWDLLRYSVADCGEPIRVNDEVIPRESYPYTYTEPAPAMEKLFYYRIYPVDANRQQITLCYYSNVAYGWATCPEFSAPIALGTLSDQGWALWVEPCPHSCYSYFFIPDNQPLFDELRQYADTGEVLRLYGGAGCGSVEGCALYVDHYDLAACVVTPTLRTSWGSVKAIYR